MKEVTVEMLRELEGNHEFFEKLQKATSMQDVQKVMAEYGIVLTEDELRNGYEQAISIYKEKGYVEDGELTESGLDMVSGGVNMGVCGAGIAAGVAGLGLMMSGPIGWGAVALWAGGCAVASCGIFMRRRR